MNILFQSFANYKTFAPIGVELFGVRPKDATIYLTFNVTYQFGPCLTIERQIDENSGVIRLHFVAPLCILSVVGLCLGI